MTSIARNPHDSEKWLESELRKRVRKLGGKALKYASPAETGYPDRIVMLPHGILYWVELKSKGEEPRKIQEIRMNSLMHLGQKVLLIDSEESLDRFALEMKYDLNSRLGADTEYDDEDDAFEV